MLIKKAALQSNTKLLPHQEEAVNKFLKTKNSIFFHGTGSGKTISSLAGVEASGSKNPLILVPASLKKNYEDSIKKFVAKPDQSKYTVESYQKFRMNPEKIMKSKPYDTLVVDELQNQRNKDSLSWKSIKQVRSRIPSMIGMTATPINNGPSDIFPLINLVSSGKVPITSQKDFEKKYVTVKKKYPKGIIKNIYSRLTGRYGEEKVLKNTDEIKKQIAPYVHKNTPSENFLKNFPKKEEVFIDVPMNPHQQKVYKYFEKKDLNTVQRFLIHNDLPPKMKNSQNFFSRLSSMRQIADSPSVASSKFKDPYIYSGKIKKSYENLQKHLSQDNRNKALIYSNFTRSGLGSISEILNKNKVPYGVFSGDIPKKQRNKALSDYNEGKIRTLLVSPSGSAGIDTRGTTLLQSLEPQWNPSVEKQIFGRAVRYRSHDALPENMRKVRIEKYRSVSRPGFFKRLMGKKQEPTIDHYIYNRSAEKANLNKQMDDLL